LRSRRTGNESRDTREKIGGQEGRMRGEGAKSRRRQYHGVGGKKEFKEGRTREGKDVRAWKEGQPREGNEEIARRDGPKVESTTRVKKRVHRMGGADRNQSLSGM
jgi:hypothetical protein